MEELETQPQATPEPEATPEPDAGQHAPQTISIEEWMASSQPAAEEAPEPAPIEDVQLLAVLEACVYVAEEPLMPAQIAAALNQEPERIRALMQQLMAEFERPEHGLSIREVAGGYKMATKAEHHEAVRNFVKSLKAPLKLSLPALETLAVVAYKQPVTSPEIQEIRGVQGTGVLKTLLERKLVTEAGRKNVIGKPILYKTTKEFLIQFGLKDLSELPTLKEFEEIRRMAMSDEPAEETPVPVTTEASATTEAAAPEGEAGPAIVTEAAALAPEAEPAQESAAESAAEATATLEAEAPTPESEASQAPAAGPEPAPEASGTFETESPAHDASAMAETEAPAPEPSATTEADAPAPESEASQAPAAEPEPAPEASATFETESPAHDASAMPETEASAAEASATTEAEAPTPESEAGQAPAATPEPAPEASATFETESSAHDASAMPEAEASAPASDASQAPAAAPEPAPEEHAPEVDSPPPAEKQES